MKRRFFNPLPLTIYHNISLSIARFLSLSRSFLKLINIFCLWFDSLTNWIEFSSIFLRLFEWYEMKLNWKCIFFSFLLFFPSCAAIIYSCCSEGFVLIMMAIGMHVGICVFGSHKSHTWIKLNEREIFIHELISIMLNQGILQKIQFE